MGQTVKKTATGVRRMRFVVKEGRAQLQGVGVKRCAIRISIGWYM